jgi:hypothetical protein
MYASCFWVNLAAIPGKTVPAKSITPNKNTTPICLSLLITFFPMLKPSWFG